MHRCRAASHPGNKSSLPHRLVGLVLGIGPAVGAGALSGELALREADKAAIPGAAGAMPIGAPGVILRLGARAHGGYGNDEDRQVIGAKCRIVIQAPALRQGICRSDGSLGTD